jgi:hypothetical protein
MRRAVAAICLSAVVGFGAGSIAFGADMPVKAPVYQRSPETVLYASGLYLSAQASWQRVHLPSYALGFRRIAASDVTDQGVESSFVQRFDGANIRGVIGYVFPSGTFRPMLGANVRAEVGASYWRAKATQAAASVNESGLVALAFLNGSGPEDALFCHGSLSCATSSTLSSDIRSWHLNGKFASDFGVGLATLTPSLAIFGGRTRNDQTLAQSFTQFFGTIVFNSGTYNASTSLSWSDLGARLGLDGSIDVNNWMTVGLGGYAGFASRRVSLSGNDIGADSGVDVFEGASAISIGANTTAFVAKAEANMTLKVTPDAAIRAFTGVIYDSRVPGVAGPRFAGDVSAPITTPAGITLQSEASYYVGGGGTVKF